VRTRVVGAPESRMPNASPRTRTSSRPPPGGTPRRRARSVGALTVGLLDALDTVLRSDLDDDSFLAATARIVARDVECLCVIERLVPGGCRVVGLAHPDPALTGRLSAAFQPDLVVSNARASAILARPAALAKVLVGERNVERHALDGLVGPMGIHAWSFVAIPLVVRGSALGVLWLITTRRGRTLREPEKDSVVRACSVIALGLAAASAASAAGANRETTATRRTNVSRH
jgi:hypothetical protein